jgi:ATP-dependent Clp protease adapter protein ClpS
MDGIMAGMNNMSTASNPVIGHIPVKRMNMLSEDIETDTDIEQLIEEINELSEEKEHRAILHNDEFHIFDDVVAAVQIATGKSYIEAFSITSEAHNNGKAVCYSGLFDDCIRVANILRNAGLLVDVD